jgi:hypothetical protein
VTGNLPTYCCQIINKLPCMNRTALRVRYYCVEVYRLIIFLHSKRYLQSSMLSLRQNSHASRGRRCTGRGEAQSREFANRFIKDSVRGVLQKIGQNFFWSSGNITLTASS